MKLMLDVDIPSPQEKITYNDAVFLIGSCFTEHIGRRLDDFKFSILQNPNGILFDPVSVCKSLLSYVRNTLYGKDDLFYLNELWQSWNHHSLYSGMDAAEVVVKINRSQQQAHNFLKQARWLIITLGSSYSYQLQKNQQPVANCHRAPGQWFNKYLLPTQQTYELLKESIISLKNFNPHLKLIFTVSPVRHIRDGVIHNNRSKARLIEAVHTLVDEYEHVHYFPAYELVIDVLRDYRFYDIDLVHPNYAATEFVFNKFQEVYMSNETLTLMEEVKKVMLGYKHRPQQPNTEAHKKFMEANVHKVLSLQQQLPHLDFSKELLYFSTLKGSGTL